MQNVYSPASLLPVVRAFQSHLVCLIGLIRCLSGSGQTEHLLCWQCDDWDIGVN